MSKKVADWYDEFTVRQIKMGINARNKSIQNWLLKFGLKKEHNVLEIGCGIGTQTQLLAEYLNSDNQITAIDISPKSIQIAQDRYPNFKGINWIAADFVTYNMEKKFDVILMPDVLEHIPVDQHKQLFGNIRKVLKKNGFVLIHIPQPYYQEWVWKNRPELMQVIDQSIYTNVLANDVYSNDLYIWHLETYSIWQAQGDYQVIVLKPNRDDIDYSEIPPTFAKKVKGKLKWYLKKMKT